MDPPVPPVADTEPMADTLARLTNLRTVFRALSNRLEASNPV